MNPDGFTLRELVRMAEGRGKLEWGQTSSLMALVANVLRDPKKGKISKPADFNPYFQDRKPVKAPLSILRDVFCKPGKGGDSV
ncbi:MAG: hypothetical protein BWY31_04138 [Lentisphaerae bacterium ADurb.Bin242]|nr:MAG: hypothetical protein BWY31_04138 [Lentisphaerae bacterium ADurb.Bin242]